LFVLALKADIQRLQKNLNLGGVICIVVILLARTVLKQIF